MPVVVVYSVWLLVGHLMVVFELTTAVAVGEGKVVCVGVPVPLLVLLALGTDVLLGRISGWT